MVYALFNVLLNLVFVEDFSRILASMFIKDIGLYFSFVVVVVVIVIVVVVVSLPGFEIRIILAL